MTREQVYRVIDSERFYQDTKWGSEKDNTLSIADWILFMEKHLSATKEALYSLSIENALIEVRKIAALAVACMECNGGEER